MQLRNTKVVRVVKEVRGISEGGKGIGEEEKHDSKC